MSRRENREISRWFIAVPVSIGILVWLYALEPVLKAWGWWG